MQTLTLNNGVEMPQEGFGVYQITDAAQCEQAVLDAIAAGYRHIDTAAIYGNEEAVGAAIRKCGVPRAELFVTTKLWVQDAGYEQCKAAFQASLARLGLDYLDLYLVHQPFGDYYGAWRAMEELYEAGKVRAIGVSNFAADRLTDLCLHCRVVPAVDQVELHPFHQQQQTLAAMREYGVQPEAWGSLAEGARKLLDSEVLAAIARRHGKTAAQVALRWGVQQGAAIIPKSVHVERMRENIDIWDFALSADDMAAIAALDTGRSELVDHHSPDFVKLLCGMRVHD